MPVIIVGLLLAGCAGEPAPDGAESAEPSNRVEPTASPNEQEPVATAVPPVQPGSAATRSTENVGALPQQKEPPEVSEPEEPRNVHDDNREAVRQAAGDDWEYTGTSHGDSGTLLFADFLGEPERARGDRPQTSFFDHETGWVHVAKQLADGRVATGGIAIDIWDPNDPTRERVRYLGHREAVSVIEQLPDGRIVSTGSNLTVFADAAVHVWDPEAPNEPAAIYRGHKSRVHDIVALDDGWVASASIDYTVHIWHPDNPSLARGVYVEHSDTVEALAFLSDGRLASGSQDGTVHIWDPANPAAGPEERFGFGDLVDAIVELPDGRLAVGGFNGPVKLWDFSGEENQIETSYDGPNSTSEMRLLDDGRMASIGTPGSEVHVWRIDAPEDGEIFVRHDNPVFGIDVLDDGRIISVGRTTRIWDPDNPEGPVEVRMDQTGRVTALHELSDGRIATGGDDETVRFWDPESDSSQVAYTGHSGRIVAIVELPDGRIASGALPYEVHVWNPTNPAVAASVFTSGPERLSYLAVLPDGRIVAAGERVHIWDPTNAGQDPIVYAGNDGGIRGLAILADGRIASSDYARTIHIWHADRSESADLVFESVPPGLVALAEGGLLALGSKPHIWSPTGATEPVVIPWHLEPETTEDGTRISYWGRRAGPKAGVELADGRMLIIDSESGIWLWELENPAEREFLIETAVSTAIQLSDGRIAVAGAGVHIYDTLD